MGAPPGSAPPPGYPQAGPPHFPAPAFGKGPGDMYAVVGILCVAAQFAMAPLLSAVHTDDGDGVNPFDAAVLGYTALGGPSGLAFTMLAIRDRSRARIRPMGAARVTGLVLGIMGTVVGVPFGAVVAIVFLG